MMTPNSSVYLYSLPETILIWNIYRNYGQNKWCWLDDNGRYHEFDDVISARFDDLDIGQCMKYNIMRNQYELTKISNNKGQQRNIRSNKIREVCKMGSIQQHNNHNKPIHKSSKDNTNDDEKELISISCVCHVSLFEYEYILQIDD